MRHRSAARRTTAAVAAREAGAHRVAVGRRHVDLEVLLVAEEQLQAAAVFVLVVWDGSGTASRVCVVSGARRLRRSGGKSAAQRERAAETNGSCARPTRASTISALT